MTTGERIRLLRKRLNLRQGEFAERLGKGIATIKRWESGQTIPNDKTLRLIARTFGVSYKWLKEGKGEMFVREEELPQTERELAVWIMDTAIDVAEKLGINLTIPEALGITGLFYKRFYERMKRNELSEEEVRERIKRFLVSVKDLQVSYEWLKEGKGEPWEPQRELPRTEEELVLWVVKKTMEVTKETGVKLSPSEVFDVARIAFNRLSEDLRNNGLSEEEGKDRIKEVINFLKNTSS